MPRLTAVLVLSLLAFPAAAQEAAGGLPAVCLAGASPSDEHGAEMSSGMDMGSPPADAGHKALMDAVTDMGGMAAAIAAPDVDVAFVCGMIPHHRAAVAMAKAELAHGDDPWARELAGEIIAAQEREIATMTAWLEKQPH